MKAFVTGATGFIGGALVKNLAAAGWEVAALVRPSSRHKLPPLAGVRVLEGDLYHPLPGLADALSGCDVVFHAAAIRDEWGTSLAAYRQVNVEGTRTLLEAAAGKVKRFVYVSSVGVFGKGGVLHIDETFPATLDGGKQGYHGSKRAAEELVFSFSNRLEVVVIRPTITYGPGDWDGMLTRLIGLIARKRFLRVGNGRNHLHLTYIDDLVNGLVLAGVHPAAPPHVFVISGPQSITSGEMVEVIEARLGQPASSWFIPEGLARMAALALEGVYSAGRRTGLALFRKPPFITRDKIDTLCLHRSFSSKKAQHTLGYQSSVGYTEGLEETLLWMSSHNLLHFSGVNTPSPHVNSTS